MTTTQTSLLVRLRSKQDSEAWNRFVRIYTPLVHCWVRKIGVSGPAINDLVQEIFVVLVGKASWISKNIPDSFRSWLRTVTFNKCRDHFRRLGRRTEPTELGPIDLIEGNNIEELTEQEYHQYVAAAAMNLMKESFSEDTWKACWMSVVEDLSAKEIGEKLGMSQNAVYLARGRVLRRLRKELEGLWE